MIEIQSQIDELKQKLSDAETSYAHAIASNDLGSVPQHRKTIGKYRNQIGKLIKIRLGQ